MMINVFNMLQQLHFAKKKLKKALKESQKYLPFINRYN